MARIRSVHPSQWTDEEFVTCSMAARLLAIGIRNEADDQGAFEWKPLTLKMRLMPADNVDVAALLDELEKSGQVRRYEVAGKAYGVIRNFAKFQSPKKPNSIYPMTDEARAFAGHQCGSGSEVVGNQFPTGGETSRQMEKEREKDTEPDGSSADDAAQVVAENPDLEDHDLKTRIFGPALDWLAKHTGKTAAQLRPMVGRWCSSYGDGRTLEALQAAARASPVDPVGYVNKLLKKGKRNERPDLDEQFRHDEAAFDRAFGMDGGTAASRNDDGGVVVEGDFRAVGVC